LLTEPIWAAISFACAQLLGILTCQLMSAYIIYRLHKAVASRYMIDEPQGFLESWCCGVCLLMKLSRHVDRAQGYIRYDIMKTL
jgi:hypothetical protein